jgi:1-phosphofructokinase family hexose kinase
VIVAAGLSPAWQQILCFDRLTLGEVNRAAEAYWCASGKVLNVAVALAHLGAECRAVCPLGGPARLPIEQELAAFGVDMTWVDCRRPTRVCTTLVDRASGVVSELVENSPPLEPAELAAYVDAFRQAAVGAEIAVLSGSLPAQAPPDFYRELLSGIKLAAVIDARGPELLAALEMRPLVVKPNREELAQTLGRSPGTDADLVDGMRQLNRAGAVWVVVTSGKRPVWMTSAEKVLRFEPPAVAKVENPIGCGDCMAAGIAYGLALGKSPEDAVSLGMAAAADNLSHVLPARLHRDVVLKLAGSISHTSPPAAPGDLSQD